MKNVITAIGEKEVNEELAKEKNIRVIGKDILYKDAVFEILEKNKIDYLIISENIVSLKKILEDIKKIKKLEEKIKIIYIIKNKTEKIKKLLKEKNINIILINKKINNKYLLIKIKEIIRNKNNNKNNYFEINLNNRKIKNKINIFNKTKKYILQSIKFIIKKVKVKKSKNLNNKNIIIIIGKEKIGKSTITVGLARECQEKFKSKILIIDFNIFNQNIYSYFNNKKYSKKIYKKLNENNYYKEDNYFKKNNINLKNNEKNNLINNKNYLIKNNNKNNYRNNKKNNLINKKNIIKKFYLNNSKRIINDFLLKSEKNIDYISGLDLIFKKERFVNQKIKNKIIKDIFLKAKEKYKFVFVDTGSDDKLNLNSLLLENCTKILLITEANLLGIKEVREKVKKLNDKEFLTKDKLKIIVNNYEKESIDREVLKKCLKDFSIIGNIKTENNKRNLEGRNKKVYKKIIKRIV